MRVRPKFEAALEACRAIKAHAPHSRVILTVYEMKRPGRDPAELTAPAGHLTAHGIALEMLAGPLTGSYDPSGTGRVLFAFFAAMAEGEHLPGTGRAQQAAGVSQGHGAGPCRLRHVPSEHLIGTANRPHHRWRRRYPPDSRRQLRLPPWGQLRGSWAV
ncbi:recombinase family protein [Nonomuraea sp. NPDC003709]|uniref:recombinase family protein n=1 Tax=Nonomuraea sp. NPDC003709 TaxID=3154450 RepID=UPI0033B05023